MHGGRLQFCVGGTHYAATDQPLGAVVDVISKQVQPLLAMQHTTTVVQLAAHLDPDPSLAEQPAIALQQLAQLQVEQVVSFTSTLNLPTQVQPRRRR